MKDELVLIPGGRDVRGTLDFADCDASAAVVACPPHPRYGGSRSDSRIIAVSAALADRGVDCLRFDYGDWDEGRGERTDAERAVRWAVSRYDCVGLFGYSFGAGIALLAAAGASVSTGNGDDTTPSTEDAPPQTDDTTLAAVSVLAPLSHVGTDSEVTSALDAIDAPVQVVYGERDDTVDWQPVAERARALGHDVVGYPSDHFFVGQGGAVGEVVAAFLTSHLR
ncbi:MAG: alpha/beta hydrolase [Halobacteriota archaeon]